MMDEAVRKEQVHIDATVICPDCGNGEAKVIFHRKDPEVRVDCPDCGIVQQEVPEYGPGVVVGRQ